MLFLQGTKVWKMSMWFFVSLKNLKKYELNFFKFKKAQKTWLSFLKPRKSLKSSKSINLIVDFHQAGSSQNEQSLLFQAFKALELSKVPCFVKRSQWVDFHQAGSSQNDQSLVLLTKAAKNGRWVSYSFLQVFSSFAEF